MGNQDTSLKPSSVPLWSYTEITIGLSVLAGLYFISSYNYLLFHSLAEIFSIAIAAGLFMIAWNTRRVLDNQYLLFIGIAYLFVGVLDTTHTLVYPGMAVIPGLDTNPPTQLWIAARYTESLSLLVAPLFFRRRLNAEFVFFSYTLITLFILGSIFLFHIFPDCYIQGKGLTTFKVASEFVISGILLGALALLMIRREEFDAGVFKLISLSIAATIFSELSFTVYVNVNELSNLVGHYLKILSFYLIYKALIQTGLTRPYDLLFRNLRASEERYRGLVELSPEAIFINRDDRIVFVNPAALQLFGATSADQILGKSPFDVFHRDYHSIMRDRIRKLLRGQPVDMVEMKIVRMDGTAQDVEAVASPFLDPEGPAIQAILHDITERKQAEQSLRLSEEALRQANEHLEQRVRERTMDLQNLTGQLERSRDDLRKLASELVLAEERERKRIATVLHDDIAQTLAAVKMQLSILQAKPDSDTCANDMIKVQGLLHEAILETRALMNEVGNPLLFDLGVAAACESLANRLMARHPIAITFDIHDALEDLTSDMKVILFQVIRELLNNVVKHSKARNANVRIERDNGFIRAKIKDDGSGFDARLLGAPTAEGGFGLFSIRERLMAFNGSLQIESAPGKGTTATATLPHATQ
jgi:PAS domain S-box-containing protein